MAERYAVSAGNWVAARFDGGTLPGVGDTVHANGFAITIDTSITVAALSTRAGTTAVAGGGFTASGAVTINADSYAGSSLCLALPSGSGAIQNGDSYGSLTAAASGTLLNASTTQNGTANGGNSVNRFGTNNFSGTLNGNSYGGSGAGGNGANIVNFGVQNGNSYGGTAAGAIGSSLSVGGRQIGDSYGSNTVAAAGTSITNGGVQVGDSFGGTAASSVGSSINAGFQTGDANGGTGSNATGSDLSSGASFRGSVFAGSGTTARGVVVSNGAVCVAEATSSTVNAKAIRIGNYGVVILQGTAISADVDIGSSAGLYELATGISPNYPFVEAGGASGFPLSRVLN